MDIQYKVVFLEKLFPLRISRGLRTGADSLFVSVTKDGITGWGEMSPGASEGAGTVQEGQEALEAFAKNDLEGMSIYEMYDLGREQNVAPCAYAALDIALWDWLAKKAGMPLYKMLGIGKPHVPTSVTIGINPPEVVKERVPLLLDGTGVRSLKIKLGSPEGIDADKAMFRQVIESTKPYDVKIRVDANGGWSVPDAIHMMQWLADLGVDYVEQPLVEGAEKELPYIFKNRPLPVFVDESCRFAHNIPSYAHCVDGVNLKLMKSGGITEGLRVLATAKAFGLKTMIGCMGESSISIAAGAALTGIIDHIDLDSHLNLNPDPCEGAPMIDGIIVPTDNPGHGGRFKES
jgi:L-alanine-DL-glutamate epimerase-like enolase superfamily enzyme